jgi:hypothetical protein
MCRGGYFVWLLPWLALSACSVPLGPVLIDGQMVPRQQLHFTGQPYSVDHQDAYPRPVGASSGLQAEGGRISGLVCGASIEYDVEHTGDRIKLSGFLQHEYQSRLEISDSEGYRMIRGSLAYKEVKLALYANRLQGYIGRCAYDLQQDDDSLTQLITPGYIEYPRPMGNAMRLRVNGLDALFHLPPADMAAVVPLVLSCLSKKMFENWGRAEAPAMGFGGEATAVPLDTLSFMSSRAGYCHP